MKQLPVKYNDEHIGTLSQDVIGKISFVYNETWLEEGFPISISLPLREDAFRENECRAFFSGLLPEDALRDKIARNLGVSSRSDFALLRAIGGDCAGAITIGESESENKEYLEKLSVSDLNRIINSLKTTPMLAGEKNIRLSLAGAQRKLPIIYKEGDFFLSHGDIPTTHIIKPAIDDIENSVENEFFCLKLADSIGLPVADADLIDAQDQKILLIRRYDRIVESEKTMRIHQEDLCQAMNIASENKYQRDGGAGFADLFSVIRNYSINPILDIRNIIRISIFNYIIGNSDVHGKNFSFLFYGKNVKLAPFYDLLSTEIYQNLDKKMAMKISDKYDPNDLFLRHWHRFAEQNQMKSRVIDHELQEIVKNIKLYSKVLANQLFVDNIPETIERIIFLIDSRLKRLEKE